LAPDKNRPQIEAAASMKFDASDIEPETYEGNDDHAKN
jgi:hypothetical protein